MNEKLTIDELRYVQDEVKLKGKRIGISYMLFLLFGFFGIHLGYLGRIKSAVGRALLTISTVAVFFPARAAVSTSEAEGVTTQLQLYSSSIFVVYAGVILAALLWAIFDLVAIPSMVRKSNDDLEAQVTTKTVQSRYVAEQLRKDEVSQILIGEITKDVSSKIKIYVEKESNKVDDKMSALEKDIMDRREYVGDFIDIVDSNMKEFTKLALKLDGDIKNANDNFSEQVELINSDIERFVEVNRAALDNLRSEYHDEHEYTEKQELIVRDKEPIDEFKNELSNTFAQTDESAEVVQDSSANKDNSDNLDISDNSANKADKDNQGDKLTPETVVTYQPQEIEKDVVTYDEEENQDVSVVSVVYGPKENKDGNQVESLIIEDESEPGELGEPSEPLLLNQTDVGYEYKSLFDKVDTGVLNYYSNMNQLQVTRDSYLSTSLNQEEVTTPNSNSELKELDYITVNEALVEGKGVHLVKGYIVGYMSPDKHKFVSEDFDGDMNIVIADNKGEDNTDKMIITQLSWDSRLREDIGLLSNPGNIGTRVVVHGELGNYFKGLGVKNVTSVSFFHSGERFISVE